MDIEASARKHGVSDDDMLHALRHHLASLRDRRRRGHDVHRSVDERRAVGGRCRDRRRRHCGDPRHAGPAKVPETIGEAMSSTREQRATNLERWANDVDSDDLREVDTDALRQIVDLVDQRRQVDDELDSAVRAARIAHRSWSEIGAMLGVSKQAAQRKYGNKTVA